jgi:hypothetical protein
MSGSMSSALATYVHEAEIVDQVRVLALLNPFTMQRVELYLDEGLTVGEMVRAAGMWDWTGAVVHLDGALVPESLWERVRPYAGHLVTIRAVPRGGGGSGNKAWITVAIGVVVLIVGIVLAVFGFGVGTPLIVAGIGIILGGVMQMVMPPPQVHKLKDATADKPIFSITGSRNAVNPYGAVPRVYGKHKIFPPFGALPYTEVVGNFQYLRQMFVVGYGPLEITDIRIGSTSISAYTNVELDILQGFPDDPPSKLFPGDVFEDSIDVGLALVIDPKPNVQPEPVRETRGAVDEFSVDIVFRNGLFHIDGNGIMVAIGARVNIHYREAGNPALPWLLALDTTYTGMTAFPVRKSFRFVTPRHAVYQVRVKQFGGSIGQGSQGSVTNAATWSVLRSVVYRDPIALTGLCKIVLRIKATDQLNGVVDQLSVVAQSILPDWDAETGTWITRATSNPASIFRNILQGTANARPIADNRLDLPALQAWHTECKAQGREFNYVVEQQTTVNELIKQVTAVGRATLGSIDGTFGVVRDVPQIVPVQHFTQRNSRDFTGLKLFREIPHAVKARFIDPLANWEISELIVYDDGYSAANATKLEAMQFFGMTDPTQVMRAARYQMAAARLRPEVFEFTTDVEHIVCTRGDMIQVTHDVLLVGLGAGRVKGVTSDSNGSATAVALDDSVPMVADGTRYQISFRRSDESVGTAEVTVVAGEQTSVTFLAPLATPPAIGDIFTFGTLGSESLNALVTRIAMQGDLGARISCVDAAPNIHVGETGLIPPYDPHITKPPDLALLVSPAPIIDGLVSDETVMVRDTNGVLQSRIVVFLHFRSTQSAVAAGAVDVRYRESAAEAEEDWKQFSLVISGDAIQVPISPVLPGVAYDIRLRSINPQTGAVSQWAEILGYVVRGQTSPPPDVISLAAEGLLLRWIYPTAPLDFDGFQIRRHRGTAPAWAAATPLHDGLITDTNYTVSQDVGTITYLIKGIDVAGTESVNAASCVIVHPAVSAQTKNVLATIDKLALGWPGTHNGQVVGPTLRGKADPNFWPDIAVATAFWPPSNTELFWVSRFMGLTYLTAAPVAAANVPCGIWLDITAVSSSWDLAYRSSGTGPFYIPTDADPFWARGA